MSGDGSVIAYEGKYGGHLVVRVLEPGGGGRSILITRSASGEPANQISFCPSLSADGEVMAFCSDADNLVPGDTNGETDVFVTRLRLSGKKKSVPEFDIARVNVSQAGEQANRWSGAWLGWHGPSLSANGRFVAFPSLASNLVPGDTNELLDIFVRDLESDEMVMVSRSLAGNGGNGHSDRCVVSGTGEHVAFTSLATDLVEGEGDTRAQVYAWNRSTRQTVLISKGPDGAPADSGCSHPTISSDGRFIAFSSSATNLTEGPTVDDTVHLYVCDRDPDRDGEYQSDSLELSAVLVPRRAELMGDPSCYDPRLSSDGEWIGFQATFPRKGRGSNAEWGGRGVVLVPVRRD